MKLAGWIVLLTWVVLGLLLAWLCSWIWPIQWHGSNIGFYIDGVVYFVVSVTVAAVIMWRAKVAQSSDA